MYYVLNVFYIIDFFFKYFMYYIFILNTLDILRVFLDRMCFFIIYTHELDMFFVEHIYIYTYIHTY